MVVRIIEILASVSVLLGLGYILFFMILCMKDVEEQDNDTKTPEVQQKATPFDCGLDPDVYDEGLIEALDEIVQSFTDRIGKLEKAYTGEVKNIRTPERPQEVTTFDCGLDPDEYDEGLIDVLNKMGTDFQARIKNLETASAEKIKDTGVPDEDQEATPFDCGLDPDVYDEGLIEVLDKMGQSLTGRIEKLENIIHTISCRKIEIFRKKYGKTGQ